jgi:hypothetical protein
MISQDRLNFLARGIQDSITFSKFFNLLSKAKFNNCEEGPNFVQNFCCFV